MNRYFEEDGIKNPDGTPRRITAAEIEKKLPDIADFCRTYLGVDPVKQPMPIQPTAHYAMGGIPTDNDARVVLDAENTPMPGFYAAGEVRMRLGARRQPSGHQLPGRHPGLRPPCGSERGGAMPTAWTGQRFRPIPTPMPVPRWSACATTRAASPPVRSARTCAR